jgi:hypothetical protein
LLGSNLFYAVIQVPVSDSFLKFQPLRCLLHLLFQFLQRLLITSIQEFQRLPNLFLILLLRYVSLTGRRALLNMIVEASSVIAAFLRQAFIAGPQLIKFVDQINGVLYRSGTGIRSKIPGFVFFHLT